MSGVFDDKDLRVSDNLPWGMSTDACMYSVFHCPKCKAKHRYGHHAEYIDCYFCFHTFSPDYDSYRYETDRVTNLPIDEQPEAIKRIGTPRPRLPKPPKCRSVRGSKPTANGIGIIQWITNLFKK